MLLAECVKHNYSLPVSLETEPVPGNDIMSHQPQLSTHPGSQNHLPATSHYLTYTVIPFYLFLLFFPPKLFLSNSKLIQLDI